MIEFFKILQESGLLTAAFIIGAVAVAAAIVRSVKAAFTLSPRTALVLAMFGLSLMSFSMWGYFVSVRPIPQTTAPPNPIVGTASEGTTSSAPSQASLFSVNPMETSTNPQYSVTTNSDGVCVRAAPYDKQREIAGPYRKGTRMLALSKYADWVKVTAPDVQAEGWLWTGRLVEDPSTFSQLPLEDQVPTPSPRNTPKIAPPTVPSGGSTEPPEPTQPLEPTQ